MTINLNADLYKVPLQSLYFFIFKRLLLQLANFAKFITKKI